MNDTDRDNGTSGDGYAHEFRPERRTQPGAAPGTLVADPGALKPRLHVISYDNDHFKEEDVVGVEALATRIRKDGVTWIDVVGLGDTGVIARLGEMFTLHRLALEDVIHVHQRPKVEEYAHHLFIVFRMVDPNVEDASEQVSLFLGENCVITFQERPGDAFAPVRERLRHGRGTIRTLGADYLAYALLDASIDQFFPTLEVYDDMLETLTEVVLRRPEPGVVRDLYRVRRELFSLRRIVWASREMINNLMRVETLIKPDTRTYLRDCYDHTVQLMDMLEMQREVAASLFDIYLSSLSNRLNEIMKVLTLIGTIFLPLGFIAGVYGMNFDRASPWNMPELGWRYGYPFALALMVATTAGLLIWFRRKGWIGRARRRPPLPFRRRRRSAERGAPPPGR